MSNNSSSSDCEDYDPKYQNGKIYKVVCLDTGRIYIGSTYLTLEHRLKIHETDYKTYLNGNINFKYSYDIIKDGNYTIELIEDYPCNNRTELERQEGLHQRKAIADDNVVCINKNIAGRTRQEYNADNREIMLNKQKIYRENNREVLLEKKKEKFNCECGGKYTRTHKAEHLKSNRHQTYLKQKNSVEQMTRQIINEIVNNALANL